MAYKKESRKIQSHYSVGGSAERKRLARQGRAPAGNQSSRRQSGMDLFRETMMKKK